MTVVSTKGKTMLATLINFLNLLLAALLTGAMFGVYLALDPEGLSARQYTQMQQRGVRSLDPVMPALGAATLVATILAAVMARHDAARFGLLAAAATGFLAAGVITRFYCQPINAVIMTWSNSAPPAQWTDARDLWWEWHVTRLAFGLAGLCALILAYLPDA